MSDAGKTGKWLRFVGFGLVLASFLTLDVLLLVWMFGGSEAWQWACVLAGAALLVVGTGLILIGKRR